MCFTSGLSKIEEQNFSHRTIKSNLIESAIFKQISDYSTTKKDYSNLSCNNNMKTIFCPNFSNVNKTNEHINSSTCNKAFLDHTSCSLKNKKKEICVDTIISMNNAVYFSLVFFLGAFINNKGIIKIGTL